MTSAFDPKPEMLRIHDLHAFYGESHILRHRPHVGRGECITLLGRNGSGRSTTLKSILGLVARAPARSW
jgi:branched-chain amino acid transport system ATP-binding protein